MAQDSQLTKKERAQLKKEKKAQERAAHKAAAQRKNALQWGLGALAVLAFGGLLVWASGNGADSQDGNQWIKGGEDAPVTLVEYSDFQCPACASYYPLVKQLHEEFGDDLQIEYRHYPLTSIHPYAEQAAAASEAAGRQGKFWEMHDLLFENQRSWSNATPAEVDESFAGYAETIGLDVAQFETDIASAEVVDAVRADRAAGNRLGVRGTPTFVLQGETISNPPSYEAFRSLIAAAFTEAGVEPTAEPSEEAATTTAQAVHEHADVAVYLRGQQLDLSQDKYQSHETTGGEDDHDNATTTDGHLHEYMHLHDGNGAVIHKHMTGYSLADFFASLGIELTNECVRLDTGEEYCANELETLAGMVNGERVEDIAGYELRDEDRILISFGNERTLEEEMTSVTDNACIYSETCPERGEAPDEACVGGIGTNCEE